MENKIRVVWICEFSNPQIRQHLKFKKDYLDLLIRRFLHRQSMVNTDYGVWNTNGIEEIKNYEDIDLYVISPHYHIGESVQSFEDEGVHYFFYGDEKNSLSFQIINKSRRINKPDYMNNRKRIKTIIDEIHPDIIHVIGAENPHYSLAALDVPNNIPVIVELQTLVSDPDYLTKYPNYNPYNIECEKRVIRRADYIGTTIKEYRRIITGFIKEDAVFLDLKLAVGFKIKTISLPKEFDFIYFSANINKAFDLALEAFAIAHKSHPEIKLCVVGYYSQVFKKEIDARIEQLGLVSSIDFKGHQPTHDDVLKWVAKSRVALLPLKFDMVSTTIREAMSLCVPVVSTLTSGTPALNEKRESILLSEINDHNSLADNMIRLLTDKEKADTLSTNALETIKELYDNTYEMNNWVLSYRNIINHGIK